jgi:hypothetical protein
MIEHEGALRAVGLRALVSRVDGGVAAPITDGVAADELVPEGNLASGSAVQVVCVASSLPAPVSLAAGLVGEVSTDEAL